MNTQDTVILLHGLNRTHRSFSKMEKSLTKNNYNVINVNYPSQHFTIEELVEQHIAPIIRTCETKCNSKIHFVTHSMGGILLRYYLQYHSLTCLGNVVMLSPPNQGSEVVDMLKNFPGFKMINGPAGQQLGTSSISLPQQLGPADYPVGIITGNRSINPILSFIIPGKDDGKVSLKRARVKGMTDFLAVPYTHTMIMRRQYVINQTRHFLKNCQFLAVTNTDKIYHQKVAY